MEALDADMVKSRLVIGFADIATQGGVGAWRTSVEPEFRFTIASGSSEVQVVRDFKKSKAPFSKNYIYHPQVAKAAHAYLTQPLFSPAPFIKSIENTTTVSAQVGEAVLNTLSILGSLATGSGSSFSSSKTFTITIDSDHSIRPAPRSTRGSCFPCSTIS